MHSVINHFIMPGKCTEMIFIKNILCWNYFQVKVYLPQQCNVKKRLFIVCTFMLHAVMLSIFYPHPLSFFKLLYFICYFSICIFLLCRLLSAYRSMIVSHVGFIFFILSLALKCEILKSFLLKNMSKCRRICV